MPLTRRQFELGITPAIEEWMERLYDFLAEHKNQAYSEKELAKGLNTDSTVTETGLISYALKILVATYALDSKIVEGETYYAFQQPVEKGTWQPLIPI